MFLLETMWHWLLLLWSQYGWYTTIWFNNNLRSSIWSCDQPIVNETEIIECTQHKYRTLSGKCNSLKYPFQGAPGSHFSRIGRDHKQYIPTPDEIDLYDPDPFEIAKALLHIRDDKPQKSAPYINALTSSWAQFIVHDMIGHEHHDIDDNPHQIFSSSLNYTMKIPRQKSSDTPTAGCPYKQFKNIRTSYFDGSQVYGTNESIHNKLMDDDDPRKFKLQYIAKHDEYQIPFDAERNEYVVGETGNFWSGLNIFHLLFSLEHNFIVDKLDELYPDIDHDAKYDIARLITSAFMVKIHITEWVPTLISDEWFNHLFVENTYISRLFEENFISDNMDNFPFQLDLWLKFSDLIISQKTEDVPYLKTEMWSQLYTVHNFFKEELYFAQYTDDLYPNKTETIKFKDTFFMENTKNINDRYSMKDLLYSFGTLNTIAPLHLNSYPPSFTNFETVDGNLYDLATVDLLRGRERGLPKYTTLRKLLGLEEITSYRQLTDDEETIDTLKSLYHNIDDMDVMIGMFLENTGGKRKRTADFVLCETQEAVLIQSAFWTLRKDRFMTESFNQDTYTKYGMNYLAVTSLRDVVLRHYPELKDSLHPRVAFKVWNRFNIPENEIIGDIPLFSDGKTIGETVNKYNDDIMLKMKENEHFRYWLYTVFDIKIDKVSALTELMDGMLSKVSNMLQIGNYYTKSKSFLEFIISDETMMTSPIKKVLLMVYSIYGENEYYIRYRDQIKNIFEEIQDIDFVSNTTNAMNVALERVYEISTDIGNYQKIFDFVQQMDPSNTSHLVTMIMNELDANYNKYYQYGFWKKLYDKYKDYTYKELMDKITDLLQRSRNLNYYADTFEKPKKWGNTPINALYTMSKEWVTYDEYPTTEQEAVDIGWKLFHNGCSRADSSNIPAKAYYIDDDISYILLFTDNGLFSGSIHAFYSDMLSDRYLQQKIKNPFNEYYTIVGTIYGIEILTRDPSKMCSNNDVDDRIIGDRFLIREYDENGNNIYFDLPININRKEDKRTLKRAGFERQRCLSGMGWHYVRYWDEFELRERCDYWYPITPLYHQNVLVSYLVYIVNDGYDIELTEHIDSKYPKYLYLNVQELNGNTLRLKDSETFAQICAHDQQFLLQHFYFADPYSIVCDADEAIEMMTSDSSQIIIAFKSGDVLKGIKLLFDLFRFNIPTFQYSINLVAYANDHNLLDSATLNYISKFDLKSLLDADQIEKYSDVFMDLFDEFYQDFDQEKDRKYRKTRNEQIFTFEIMFSFIIILSALIVAYFYLFSVTCNRNTRAKMSGDGYIEVDHCINEEDDETFSFLKPIPESEYISLCWENISREINDNYLLQHVSGYVESGSVLCLLGPSGAGKTSLMEILCGLKEQSDGNVYYSGRGQIASNASYISQDILLYSGLTIRDSIKYVGKLRGCSDMQKTLDDIIHSLGLKQCENTLIGDIMDKKVSFGEQKRCLFAMELIHSPKILFLDEILSNLDAASSFYLFKIIDKLKNSGYCIILSMHQPDRRVYDIMSKQNGYNMLLLNHGKPLYFGSVKESVHYFKSIGFECPESLNPMSFFLDVVNNNFVQNNDQDNNHIIYEKYKSLQLTTLNESIKQKAMCIDSVDDSKKCKVSILSQISTLTERNFQMLSCWFRVVMYLLLSIMCGMLFGDINQSKNSVHSKVGYMMYVSNFIVLMGATYVQNVRAKRVLFIKEKMNINYSTFSWCFADLLHEIPWNVLQSLIFTLISVLMVRSRPDRALEYFMQHFLICFAYIMCVNSWVKFLSTLSSRSGVIISLMAFNGCIFAMFGGCIITVSDIPHHLLWINDISFFAHLFRAFTFMEFGDMQLKVQGFGHELYGSDVLSFFSMNDVNIYNEVLCLLFMACVYRVLHFLSWKYLVPFKHLSVEKIPSLLKQSA